MAAFIKESTKISRHSWSGEIFLSGDIILEVVSSLRSGSSCPAVLSTCIGRWASRVDRWTISCPTFFLVVSKKVAFRDKETTVFKDIDVLESSEGSRKLLTTSYGETDLGHPQYGTVSSYRSMSYHLRAIFPQCRYSLGDYYREQKNISWVCHQA